jgi:hypothetical protein
MNKLSVLILFAAFILIANACSKDDTIIEEVDCSTVTFTDVIFPIFEQSCNTSGCHGGTSYNPDFTTYETIKIFADNGKLQKEVLDDRTMPKTGSLTAEELGQIKCWLDAGAPE